MRVRVPPAMSGPIGKLMKILYKKKYDLPADWDDFTGDPSTKIVTTREMKTL